MKKEDGVWAVKSRSLIANTRRILLEAAVEIGLIKGGRGGRDETTLVDRVSLKIKCARNKHVFDYAYCHATT